MTTTRLPSAATSPRSTGSASERETTTSPGPASAITRAAMWTAMPATSPPTRSHSPVWMPARLVDELHLVIAPKLAGGRDPLTILGGDTLDPPADLSLLSLHESGGYLFARYGL